MPSYLPFTFLRLAIVFLSLLLASCAFPVVPPQKGATKQIALVHGFMESGNSMQFMCEQLETSGYDCQIFHLRPSDGRGGLEPLAARLKRDIDARFGTKSKIDIIAFSMGGLVSRHYLQELGGAPRCAKFITISTPHHGTSVARLYPSKGAQEMRPGSDFLKRLAATEDRLAGIRCISYRTPFDLIIQPTDSAFWPRAENHSYPVLIHPFMLVSQPVIMSIQHILAQPDGNQPAR